MKLFYYILVASLCFVNNSMAQEYRTYDGRGNNLNHPNWGAANMPLKWEVKADYADGVSEPAGLNRPNSRLISDKLSEQVENNMEDPEGRSNFVWLFGQFICNEMSIIPNSVEEPMFIEVKNYYSQKDGTYKNGVIPIFRSETRENEHLDIQSPRTPLNATTPWIDGSAVYGANKKTANWLRTFKNGKLKTSKGNLLPFNTYNGNFDDMIDPDSPPMITENDFVTRLFVAGNSDLNNNVLLTALHTIFVREHNRLCEQFQKENSTLSDEELYQKARRHVVATIQNILFYEWLPNIGIELPIYEGYDKDIDPSLSNEFTTAAFCFFSTLMPQNITRVDNYGRNFNYDNFQLGEAFNDPVYFLRNEGIAHLLKGMAEQKQQKADLKLVADARNWWNRDGSNELHDDATIQIEQGRERGIVSYNKLRAAYGIEVLSDFSDISNEDQVRADLAKLYTSVEEIDAWVGLLSEKPQNGALLGQTHLKIIKNQFEKLRNADRFFFLNDPDFTTKELLEIRLTKLSDLILKNTSIEALQSNIFQAIKHKDIAPVGRVVNNLDLATYPNPTMGNFEYILKSDNEGLAQVSLVNERGQLIDAQKIEVRKGINKFHFEMNANVENGYYVFKIEMNGQTNSSSMLKIDAH